MQDIIVGRIAEKLILKGVLESDTPHFVAITGRRRVGKTYLVRTYLRKEMDFEFSGMLNAPYQQQLENFNLTLSAHFKKRKNKAVPGSWLEAFAELARLLESKKPKTKKVIFIDELPWLDTHKSNFMSALDWFWNSWGSRHNVLFIVCGSATSWILNKLIRNRGGLHNRVTKRIHLSPFNLSETEAYLKHQKIALSRYQIVQLYMALGGIPHYLKEVQKGESAFQAIDRICFQENGLLAHEFENLYKALFKNSDNHEKVVFALAGKMKGLTRPEILAATKLKDGGAFTNILEELEACNFIHSTSPFGKLKKETLYRLHDEFSIFYIKFMRNRKNVNWQQLASTQTWRSWSGFAFENCCMKHIQQLKFALGIAGVYTEVSSFISKGTESDPGTQIDLLIDRNDGIINICEAKFYDKPFTLNKAYAQQLRNKLSVFQTETGSSKTLFPTMVTTFGIQPNVYSIGLIQQTANLEDLFDS